MIIFNLRGDARLKGQQVRQRLTEARNQDQFVQVTVDRNESLLPTLRVWSDEGLITAGWRMWNGDFESDNFSDQEIADLVSARASEDGINVAITGDGIREARLTASSTEGAVKSCLKGQAYPFIKDRRWGQSLAEWSLTHPCPADIDEDGDRPIVRLANYLIRACSTEFLGSVMRYRVDGTTGRIVSL